MISWKKIIQLILNILIEQDYRNSEDIFLLLKNAIMNKYIKCINLLLLFINKWNWTNKEIEFFQTELPSIASLSSSIIPEILDRLLHQLKNIQIKLNSNEFPLLQFISDYNNIGNHKFIEDNNSLTTINAEIWHSKIALPSKSGSKQSLDLLNSLNSAQNPKIFRNKFIKNFIKIKWNTLWIAILIQTLLSWSNILVLIYLLLDNKENQYAMILFICINSILMIF